MIVRYGLPGHSLLETLSGPDISPIPVGVGTIEPRPDQVDAPTKHQPRRAYEISVATDPRTGLRRARSTCVAAATRHGTPETDFGAALVP